MVPFLGAPLDAATIGLIVQTFAITDSLVSVAVTYTMTREAMVRWRVPLWGAIVLMWVALALPIIELLIATPPFVWFVSGVQVPNPLTKAAVAFWLVGVAGLLLIEYRIFRLDFIGFNKKGLEFTQFSPKSWGISGIDKVLESSARMRYPIALVANESCRPWEILQGFVAVGLKSDNPKVGAIFFAFTRPPRNAYSNIKSVLSKLDGTVPPVRNNEFWESRLRIVDCYTQVASEDPTESPLKDVVLKAHPNNPHDVNKKYERALRQLKGNGCTSIRVVYDTLSDFLAFTDPALATQYLRHNMIWEEGAEEGKGVESIYLMGSGTTDDKVVPYFEWFANGVLQLEVKEWWPETKYLDATFRGPFKQPMQFKLNFDFESLD